MKQRDGWVARLFPNGGKHPAKGVNACDVDVIAPCAWAAGATHIGRLRKNNEDGFLCAPERSLFIVADGVGGHAAGEQASAAAISHLDAFFSPDKLTAGSLNCANAAEQLIRDALCQAHVAVLALAKDHPDWAGMGSTAVVAVIQSGVLTVGNVGDSRLYLLRDESLQILTRDHSMAAVLLEQGQLSIEEARSPRFRNQLTQVLGISRSIDPATCRAVIQPGDRLVLCSDGLWDMLDDNEIARVSVQHDEPVEAVEALIRAANAAGGKDNITAILISISKEMCSIADPVVWNADEDDAGSATAAAQVKYIAR